MCQEDIGKMFYCDAIQTDPNLCDINASGAYDAFTAGIIPQLFKTADRCRLKTFLHSDIVNTLRHIYQGLEFGQAYIDEVMKKHWNESPFHP